MMIVNGDCCLDADLSGECDLADSRASAPPAPPQARTVPPSSESVQEVMLGPGDIQCGYEDRKLVLTFRNLGEKSWALNSDLSWGHPGHIENVQVYLNQYQMNKRGGTFKNGELLFGPGPLFSDACTKAILSPGQEVRCEFENVPLASPTFHNGTNEVRIHIPSEDWNPRVEFVCPARTGEPFPR